MRKLFAKSYYGGGYFALFLIGVTVIGMLAFAGCSFAPEEGRTGSAVTVDSGYATPYASVEELEAIAEESDEYVYWRVARTFALIELEAFREEAVWYNATLSERPVVVYDSKSRPKYYEYRVLRNGEEIGAVTAVAQKKDGGPTAYVLPNPGDYSGLQTKGSGFKVVANMYPRVAYGLVTKSGEDVNVAVDPVSGEVIDVGTDESMVEFLLTANSTELYNVGITNEAQRNELLAIAIEIEKQKLEEANWFWSNVTVYEEEIYSITEEEIQEAFNSTATKSTTTTTYYLSKWNTSLIRDMKLSGKCGPTTVAWIASGYYGYNSTSCPAFTSSIRQITDSTKRWQALAESSTFVNICTYDGVNAHSRSLRDGIEYATGGLYTSRTVLPAINVTMWHWVKDRMQEHQMPVISSRAYHVRAIFGTKHVYKEVWKSWWVFSWIEKSNDYYYRVHDNGYHANNSTGTFWEHTSAAGPWFFFDVYRK